MPARLLQENLRTRRHRRIRSRVRGNTERPRLVIFRSDRYLQVQIIDDSRHVTLVAVSDYGKKQLAGTKVARAQAIGQQLASLAIKQKINSVVFDRGGYAYHGRVKALAEAARAAGLIF